MRRFYNLGGQLEEQKEEAKAEEEEEDDGVQLIEGMAGPDDVDSLLFAAVSDEDAEIDMSHIEEDKNYLEEV